jgi:Holliday junction DNA helicase RuvA
MLAFIEGIIIFKKDNYFIIDNQGLGYKVFVGIDVFSENVKGKGVSLFLYHHVKEDSQSLFGFKESVDLEMFEMLLSVSGIGPKSALNLMSLAGTRNLQSSIISEDFSLLTKVSGVGKKTAERVILELKSKIAKLPAADNLSSTVNFSSDEIDALVSLGYSVAEAREALKKVSNDITDSSERIKSALKEIF